MKKKEGKEFEYIFLKIKKNKPYVSEKSAHAYSRSVYHLYKYLENNNVPQHTNFLHSIYENTYDPFLVKHILEETINNNTKRNKLSSLQAWFGDNTPNWIISVRDDLNDKYNQETISNPKKCKCKWNDILYIRRKIDKEVRVRKLRSRLRNLEYITKDNIILLINHALFRLYTEAPLRNDFNLFVNPTDLHPNNLTGLDFDPKKRNWYSPHRKEIVINDFKTNKKYEPIVIKPSKQLINDFNNIYRFNQRLYPQAQFILLFCCLDKEGLTDTELIQGANYKIATKNDISRTLYSISKKYSKYNIPVRSSDIRHIYLTDKYSEVKKEINKDATLMGHSINTQQSVYVAKPSS